MINILENILENYITKYKNLYDTMKVSFQFNINWHALFN